MALLDQPDLRRRLRKEAIAYEQRVRATLLAHRTGEIKTRAALKACGMELHSIKGAASLLGMADTARIVDSLGEHMMSASVEPSERFWSDFEHWFGLVVRHIATHGQEHRGTRASLLEQKRIELKLELGKAPSVPHVPSRRPSRVQSMAPSAGRRLLVIEDSATVRATLAARLGQRGYPVECAGDLMAVAEKLRQFDPEIVICDVHMSGIEGDEVCRRIKTHMRRLVSVILYSSLEPAELAERARRARADGHVSKTEGIEALIARMDELLSEKILF